MGIDFRVGAESRRHISLQTMEPLHPNVQSHKPWKVREESVTSSSTMTISISKKSSYSIR